MTQPDLLNDFINLMVFLAGILALGAVLFYAKRRLNIKAGQPSNNDLMQVLVTKRMGAKAIITMVKIPGVILVLGLSGERINLLTKIEDQEYIDRISCNQKK